MTDSGREILLQLKWMSIYILLFGLAGAVFAGIKVLYFEQTESGRYAVHNECVLWDDRCVQSCEDAQSDNPEHPPSCSGCCLQTKDVVEPLGKRIKKLAIQYGVMAGGIGVVVGLTIADEKKKQL